MIVVRSMHKYIMRYKWLYSANPNDGNAYYVRVDHTK